MPLINDTKRGLKISVRETKKEISHSVYEARNSQTVAFPWMCLLCLGSEWGMWTDRWTTPSDHADVCGLASTPWGPLHKRCPNYSTTSLDKPSVKSLVFLCECLWRCLWTYGVSYLRNNTQYAMLKIIQAMVVWYHLDSFPTQSVLCLLHHSNLPRIIHFSFLNKWNVFLGHL